MAKLKTGRHTSAIKELRKAKKRTETNKQVKKNIRLLAKKVKKAVDSKNLAEAKKLLNEAFSSWDKAAREGIIHKKAANRKKSSLMKLVNLISVPRT